MGTRLEECVGRVRFVDSEMSLRKESDECGAIVGYGLRNEVQARLKNKVNKARWCRD